MICVWAYTRVHTSTDMCPHVCEVGLPSSTRSDLTLSLSACFHTDGHTFWVQLPSLSQWSLNTIPN